MADLPTNRTSANTDAEHIADHNAAHALINAMDDALTELRLLLAPDPISVAPVASFVGAPLSGAPGLSVVFDENSTGNPTSYTWDFGDGTRSVQQNPTHVYAAGGSYTVKLTVINPYGQNTQTRENYVAVTVTPTTAVTITPVTPIGDGFATINWTPYAGTNTYKVGRNGVDTEGASFPTSVGTGWEEVVTGTTWTANKLVNGTPYTLHVIPVVNGVNGPTSTVSVTPVGGSPTAPPPTGTVGSLAGGSTNRKSGLPFNSLVFGHGLQPARFETWRNRVVDGELTFPYRLENWDNLSILPARRAGDIVVWSIPPFLQGAGHNNQQVVNGQHDAQIIRFCQRLNAGGWNHARTIIRLGWEANGYWYEWGYDFKGDSAAATLAKQNTFKAMWRRWVTLARANGLNNVLWDWCLNKGPQSGNDWKPAYPGDDVVDIIGLDSYDYYGPSFNESQWVSNTTNKNPGLEDVAAFVRARSKLMSLDEWGVCNPYSTNIGGGDNAWYIQRMWQWVNANKEILAWENTYDHTGNPGLNHTLSDGSNPQAAAAYKSTSRWGKA